MTPREYEYLQERLRRKITNNEYVRAHVRSNRTEAYADGIRAAMSILSEVYHQEERRQNGKQN